MSSYTPNIWVRMWNAANRPASDSARHWSLRLQWLGFWTILLTEIELRDLVEPCRIVYHLFMPFLASCPRDMHPSNSSTKMFWLALPSYTWSKIFTIKTGKQDSRTRPSLVLNIFFAFKAPSYRPYVIRTCRRAHFDCFQLAEERILIVQDVSRQQRWLW